MNKYDINIVNISKDKQHCIDSNSNHYSIKDVKKAKGTINVHVVRNVNSCSNGFPECIRYKKNCKPLNQNAAIKTQQIKIKHIHKVFGNFSTKVDICVLMEDEGSAINIIENIVENYAQNNNICISCDFIATCGATNIAYALNYELGSYKNCLLIYDSALEQSSVLADIDTCSKFLSKCDKYNIVSFTPRSSEECALSFRVLQKDIKSLSQTQVDFLKAFENYLLTGDDYVKLNLKYARSEIGGMPIKYGYSSQYIKKYNNIKNMEQYIADRLADITHDKPYEFVKHANVCWTDNCVSSKCACKMVEIEGSKSPKSRAQKCNKTLVPYSKTEAIIKYSIFGGIYDALELLLGGHRKVLNAKLTNDIITKY